MAGNSSDDTEILVHITAPSRSADDALYRQLAQAYLAFEPQKRTKLPSVSPQERKEPCDVAVQDGWVSSSSQIRIGASFGQSFEITSQDMSFEGAVDNRASPRLRHITVAQDMIPSSNDAGSESFNSWCAPASQISDSYPMPDAGLLSVSPSRILERYIGRTQSSQTSLPYSSPTAYKQSAPIPLPKESLGIPSSIPVPSQEESLRLEPPRFIETEDIITSTQENEEDDFPIPSANTEIVAFEHLVPDITHNSANAVNDRSLVRSPRGRSEPPPAKRSKIGNTQHADLFRSSSDTGRALSITNSQIDQVNSSLEIRPPSPSVGVKDVQPADLVSEKLAKLARDLGSRYRPTVARDIDPFERGYWLLGCRDWDPGARFDAWVFLSNYLKSGLAGWGTWCRRDTTHDWIRLYCWGHVAKHTYLLLYLASGRRIKISGAKWYGADGEVILEVLPQDKQG
ncbi:hypothetical protein FPSE_01811 [Fusarium pseudograminearum CS3096]|uniref:Uncharacterized protein n=1 Tax=Fusarium pseudograminearum (strain CS3096) TaxID=1028729 RepID=K3VUR8_FUSPC|nr:hypothetical protein FPSE_01811 [Fusarium pseudograminearum CS3096]EKJ78023.1 hypothetical protein FPSE_01811 [Fusarium pseudograminearum CS3096]